MATAFLFLSSTTGTKLTSPLLRQGYRKQRTRSKALASIPRSQLQETKEKKKNESVTSNEEITEKYGLEVGLWKIFTSKQDKEGVDVAEKSRGDQAKELLAKYGGAYLATSITLSLFSFALCYLLISAGIDVQVLLNKIGITTDETGGKVGTFALAYAAHKAASPIRFPPTVALTPIVANWIGKKTNSNNDTNINSGSNE